VTREGRFAFLTNVRDPERNDAAAPSRGSLVPAVLSSASDIALSLARLRAEAAGHNGFNLLAGTHEGAAWMSNRTPDVKVLGRGMYGLSNALLDTPWPKVVRTKAALADWLDRRDADSEPLFSALARRAVETDADLPSTGVTLEWERRLSAPFIVSDAYGTRSSTVLTITRDGEVRFTERSFDPLGLPTGQMEHRFRIA